MRGVKLRITTIKTKKTKMKENRSHKTSLQLLRCVSFVVYSYDVIFFLLKYLILFREEDNTITIFYQAAAGWGKLF